MTLKHKLKLIPSRIKWFIKGRQNLPHTHADLRILLDLALEEYNEGYRKNPTNHDVLRLEGRISLLKQLIK